MKVKPSQCSPISINDWLKIWNHLQSAKLVLEMKKHTGLRRRICQFQYAWNLTRPSTKADMTNGTNMNTQYPAARVQSSKRHWLLWIIKYETYAKNICLDAKHEHLFARPYHQAVTLSNAMHVNGLNAHNNNQSASWWSGVFQGQCVPNVLKALSFRNTLIVPKRKKE